MAIKKWRNPYTSINKKTTPVSGKINTLALTPTQNRDKLPVVDLRASVSKMRHNLKGISSTIRQMEETMDTLYGAMDVIDSLSKSSSRKTSPPSKSSAPVKEMDDDTQTDTSNVLGNIDVNQLLNILQSPLVQSLLSQNQLSSGTKRKKEG